MNTQRSQAYLPVPAAPIRAMILRLTAHSYLVLCRLTLYIHSFNQY
jgi:hypothetical protein